MDGSTRIGAIGSNIPASVALRRLALSLFVGGLSLSLTAVPAGAATLGLAGGGGTITAGAVCDTATRRADVTVEVSEPKAYASSGLYFYTEIWAKARYETKFNFIRGGMSPLVKTWKYETGSIYVGGVTGWQPYTLPIFSATFFGSAEAYYDILVKYWYAPPGATWMGPYGFTLAADWPNSTITEYSSSIGLGNPNSDCFL